MTLSTQLALVSLALAACAEEQCDFFDVDGEIELERDTPREVPIGIGNLPPDLHHIPTLKISAYGRSKGLSHWIIARDGLASPCESEPRDEFHACSHLRPIESRSSFNLWLKGVIAGRYELSLALYEDSSPESRLGDPVCTKDITITVR